MKGAWGSEAEADGEGETITDPKVSGMGVAARRMFTKGHWSGAAAQLHDDDGQVHAIVPGGGGGGGGSGGGESLDVHDKPRWFYRRAMHAGKVLPLVGALAPAADNSHSGAAVTADQAASREMWLLTAVPSATEHAGDMSLAASRAPVGLPAATQLAGLGGCCSPCHPTHFLFSPLDITVTAS